MSDLNAKHNRVVWMDIPVADLDRTTAFYTGVLAIELHCQTYEDLKFAILDHDQATAPASLLIRTRSAPSTARSST